MKRILIYLVTTFGLTWTFWSIGISGPVVMGMPVAELAAAGLGMFGPSAGVLAVWIVTRSEGGLDLPLHPRFQGNGRWYLTAWFAPALAVLLGGILYFGLFRSQFDPSMGYMRAFSGAAAQAYSNGQIRGMAALQIVVAVFMGPFLNVAAGAGEELGWRGLLYPALRRRLTPVPACLLGGVIWGVWHAPMTVRGHNYGLGYAGFPWMGVVMMCVFCTAVGTLLHALTERCGSIWPAALAHGGLNAVISAPMMFLPSAEAGSRLLGPTVAGLVGGVPLLLVAAAWLTVKCRPSGENTGKIAGNGA